MFNGVAGDGHPSLVSHPTQDPHLTFVGDLTVHMLSNQPMREGCFSFWLPLQKSDFVWGGFKITADGDCSHKIKRCLLLERIGMTNLDSVLKSRDITLLTKVHLVKAIVFPVVIYGCESWTIKKAEAQRINAFKLWCWRRFLRVH